MANHIIDLTGQRFGKLKVIKIGETQHPTSHGTFWQCACDCGALKEIRGDRLRTGGTKSCGCVRGQRNDLPPKKTSSGEQRAKRVPVQNKELLLEIERSKLSFCYFLQPEDAVYDARVTSEADITPELIAETGKTAPIVRFYTYDHIPTADKLMRPRQRGKGHEKTNFPPFRHVRAQVEDSNVVLEEVGRSHWTGGLGNGYFSLDHGRMTNRLGMLFFEMTMNYSRRPNWNGYSYKDEMISAALFQLSASGLEFDESKGDNPFAYLTQSMYFSFLKVLANEKKAADTRDEMLSEAGAMASHGWQDREYLRRFEPTKLVRKAGRPPKARTGIVRRPEE